VLREVFGGIDESDRAGVWITTPNDEHPFPGGEFGRHRSNSHEHRHVHFSKSSLQVDHARGNQIANGDIPFVLKARSPKSVHGVEWGMAINAFTILVVISLLLAVGSMIRPQWPLLAVAVLLMAVALLVGGK